MENIILSFNVIAPLFFLMVIGYVLVNYTGLADKELCQKANALVFKIFLPCMLFKNIYQSNIREQMYRYRVEYLKDVESRKTLVEEHYAVYRALKARNQQQAVKDICIHIVNQQNAILRSLEQMNKEEQEK